MINEHNKNAVKQSTELNNAQKALETSVKALENKLDMSLGNDQIGARKDDRGLKMDVGDFSLSGITQSIQKSIQACVRRLPLDTTTLAYFTTFGSQVRCSYYLDEEVRRVMLHSFIVARSGSGKSDMTKRLDKSLLQIQREAKKEYDKKLAEWKVLERQNAKKKDKRPLGDPPYLIPYLKTAHGTIQGLKKMLAEKDSHNVYIGTLIADSEAGGFLDCLGKYSKASKVGEAAIVTGLLDGKYVADVQVMNDYNIDMPNFGYRGEIQPDVLIEKFRILNEAIRQGFFSRFMYSVVPFQLSQHIDHQYKREDGNGFSNDIYRFEDGLLRTIIDVPNLTLEMNDESYDVFSAYSNYVTDYNNVNGTKTGLVDMFLNSLTLHSQNKVMAVASIAHILNQVEEVITGKSELGKITQTITRGEMIFATRFVLHYNRQFENFLVANGGDLGLTKKDPVYPYMLHVLRWARDRADSTGQYNNYTFTKTDLHNRFNVFKDKNKKELADRILTRLQEENAKVYENNKFKLTTAGYNKGGN